MTQHRNGGGAHRNPPPQPKDMLSELLCGLQHTIGCGLDASSVPAATPRGGDSRLPALPEEAMHEETRFDKYGFDKHGGNAGVVLSDLDTSSDEEGGEGGGGRGGGGGGGSRIMGRSGSKSFAEVKKLPTFQARAGGPQVHPPFASLQGEFIGMVKSMKRDRKAKNRDSADQHSRDAALLEAAMANPGALYKINRGLQSTALQITIYSFIFVAAVCAGLETNDGIAKNPAFLAVDVIVAIVFTVECFFNVISSGHMATTEDGARHLIKWAPYRYFFDSMNCLDFFCVAVSFGERLGLEGGSALLVLRLLRLGRVLKVIAVIPELQVILHGIAEGCKSIGYILLLLAMVIYVFAILGVILFRENDPMNFRNLGTAMYTVMDAASADWLDYLYINYHGCENYGYGGYESYCTASGALPVMSSLYFIALIIIVGNIMMSLFVGVITNKMEDAANELRDQKTELRRLVATSRGKSIFASRETAEEMLSPSDFDMVVQSLELLSGSSQNDHHDPTGQSSPRSPRSGGAGGAGGAGGGNPLIRLRRMVKEFIYHEYTESFMIVIIVAAGITAGISVDLESETLEEVENVIVVLFAIEIGLKVLGEFPALHRVFMGPNGAWNTFDVLVVCTAFIPSSPVDGFASVIRLCRLMRLLKLVRAIPALQVIVHSLLAGMSSIVYVGILMAIVFYIYAIAGVHLFRDNDHIYFGDLGKAFITLFRLSMLSSWKAVVKIEMFGCDVNIFGVKDGGAHYADDTVREGHEEGVGEPLTLDSNRQNKSEVF